MDITKADRDRESRKLHYNDKIAFFDPETASYLTQLGIQHRAVGCHLPCQVAGGSAGGDCDVQLRDRRNASFQNYLFDIIPFDADTEDPIKVREVQTMRGEVCYGEKVKLRHSRSQGFLGIPSLESPVSSSWSGENDNMQLAFISSDGPESSAGGEGTNSNSLEVCFKIIPSYRVRQEGQAIVNDDEVLLQHVELRPLHYVHTGRENRTPVAPVGEWREANLSLRDTGTTFAVKVFEAGNRDPEGAWIRSMTQHELLERYTRRDRLLKVGDPVLLYHHDHDGYLNVKVSTRAYEERERLSEPPGDYSLQTISNITEKMKSFSSNSFFCFELQDTHRGGIIALDRCVRIRHIASGMYLCHRDGPLSLCLIERLQGAQGEELDFEGHGNRSTLWMPTDEVYGEDAREAGLWDEELPAPPEGRIRNDKTYRFAGVCLPAAGRQDRPYVVRCWLGTRTKTHSDGKMVEMCASATQKFQDAVMVLLTPDMRLVHDVHRVSSSRRVFRQWQKWWRRKDKRAEEIMISHSDDVLAARQLMNKLQQDTPFDDDNVEDITARITGHLGRLRRFLSPVDLSWVQDERKKHARANIKDIFRFDHVERHRMHKRMMLEQDMHRELLDSVTAVLGRPEPTQITVNVVKKPGARLDDVLPVELGDGGMKVKRIKPESAVEGQGLKMPWSPKGSRRRSWVLTDVDDAAVVSTSALQRAFDSVEPGSVFSVTLRTRVEAPERDSGDHDTDLVDWTELAWRGYCEEAAEASLRGHVGHLERWPTPGRFNYVLFHGRAADPQQETRVRALQSVLELLYDVLRLMVKEYEPTALCMAEEGFVDAIREHILWHRVHADLCLAELLKHQCVLEGPFMTDVFFESFAHDMQRLSECDSEAARRLPEQGERDGHCAIERMVQLLAMCCVCEDTGEAMGRNQQRVHELFLTHKAAASWPRGRLLLTHSVSPSKRVVLTIQPELARGGGQELWLCSRSRHGKPTALTDGKGMELGDFCEQVAAGGNAPLMAYHVACTELFAALCRGRVEQAADDTPASRKQDPIIDSVSRFYSVEGDRSDMGKLCAVEAMKEAQAACVASRAGARDGRGAAVCPAYAALVRDWLFSEPKDEQRRLVCRIEVSRRDHRMQLFRWDGAVVAERHGSQSIRDIKQWVAGRCRELSFLQQNNVTGVKMVLAALTLCRQLVLHGYYTDGGAYRDLAPPMKKAKDRRTADEGLAVSLFGVLNPTTDGRLLLDGRQGGNAPLSEEERRHYCDANLPLFRIKLEVCSILHALLDDKIDRVYLPAVLGLSCQHQADSGGDNRWRQWRREHMRFWTAGGLDHVACRSFFPEEGFRGDGALRDVGSYGESVDPTRRGFHVQDDGGGAAAGPAFFADITADPGLRHQLQAGERSDTAMICKWLDDNEVLAPFELSGDDHLVPDFRGDSIAEDPHTTCTTFVRYLLEMALYQYEPLVSSALNLLFRTVSTPLEVNKVLRNVVMLEEDDDTYRSIAKKAQVLRNKVNDVRLRGRHGVAPPHEREVMEEVMDALFFVTDMCLVVGDRAGGSCDMSLPWEQLRRGVSRPHAQRLLACTGVIPQVLRLIDEFLNEEHKARSRGHSQGWWSDSERTLLRACYRLLAAFVKDSPESAQEEALLTWVTQRAKGRLKLHIAEERRVEQDGSDDRLLNWDLTNFLIELCSHRAVCLHFGDHKDLVWMLVKQLCPRGGSGGLSPRHLRLLRHLVCVHATSRQRVPDDCSVVRVPVEVQPDHRGAGRALGVTLEGTTVATVAAGSPADCCGVRRGMQVTAVGGTAHNVRSALEHAEGDTVVSFQAVESTQTVMHVADEVVESNLVYVINHIVAEKHRVLMLLRDSCEQERRIRGQLLRAAHREWRAELQGGQCAPETDRSLPWDEDGHLKYHIELVSLFAKALRGNIAVLTHESAFDALWPPRASGPFPLYFQRPYAQLLAEYLARDDKQDRIMHYTRRRNEFSGLEGQPYVWNLVVLYGVLLRAMLERRWTCTRHPPPYRPEPSDDDAEVKSDGVASGGLISLPVGSEGKQYLRLCEKVMQAFEEPGDPERWQPVTPAWYNRRELEEFITDAVVPFLGALCAVVSRDRRHADQPPGSRIPRRKHLQGCLVAVAEWVTTEHFESLRQEQQAAVRQLLEDSLSLDFDDGPQGRACCLRGCSRFVASDHGTCLAHHIHRGRIAATRAMATASRSRVSAGNRFADALAVFQSEFRDLVYSPGNYADVPDYPSESVQRAAIHLKEFYSREGALPGVRVTKASLLAFVKRGKRVSEGVFQNTYLLRQKAIPCDSDKESPTMLSHEYFSTFADILVSPYLPLELTADVLGVLSHGFAEPWIVSRLERQCSETKGRTQLVEQAREALAKVDERKKEVQGVFCQRGAVQRLLTLMEEQLECKAKTQDIHAAALDLLRCLLEGGDRLLVQHTVHNFFLDRTTEGFFVFCRLQMKRFEDVVKDWEPGSMRGEDCETLVQCIADMETMLRVLQLLCEGHYESLQNYLRTQDDNSFSVNVIKEVAMFARFLTKTKDGILVKRAPHLVQQAFDTLTEFCQGPCRKNQEVLVEVKIPALVGDLLGDLAGDASRSAAIEEEEEDEEMDEDVVGEDNVLSAAIGTLLSLTEGVGSNTGAEAELHVDVPKQLLDMLRDNNPKTGKTNLAHLMERMNDSWIKGAVCRLNRMDNWVWGRIAHAGGGKDKRAAADDEEEEEELKLGYSIFIFLLSLCRFDKRRLHHHDEVLESPLKVDLRQQMSYSFFNERVAQIEIMAKDRSTIEKVYFKKPPQTALLQEETKQKVNVQVTRDSRETKIQGFFSRWHDLVEEIIIYNERNNTAWSSFIRWGLHLEYVSLAMSLVISIYLMLFMKRVNDPATEFLSREYYTVFLVLAILQITLEMLMLIGWLQIKGRVITRKHVKQAQRETANAQKTGLDASQWQTYMDWSKKPAFSQFYLGLYILALHREFYVVCLFAASAWAGLFGTPIFFSVQIFRIIQRSDSLQNVIRSVTEKWQDLLWTMSLGIVAIYLFSMVSFYYYSDKYYDVKRNPDLGMGFTCQELGRCFLLNLVYGLRQGGGLADVLQHPDWHGGKNYVARLVFDFLFWVVMIIIFLNIIFGIILDTFAELRDRKQDRERDQKTKCFICGQEAYEFDKSRFSNFDEHYRRDHNMWDYLHFFLYLHLRNSDEYTGQETYVKNRIDRNLTDFFPESAIVLLEEEDDSGKEEEMREKSIEQKVTKLLSLVQQQESRHRPAASATAMASGGGPGGGPGASVRSNVWFGSKSPGLRGDDRRSVQSFSPRGSPAQRPRVDPQLLECTRRIAALEREREDGSAAEWRSRDEKLDQLLHTAQALLDRLQTMPMHTPTPPIAEQPPAAPPPSERQDTASRMSGSRRSSITAAPSTRRLPASPGRPAPPVPAARPPPPFAPAPAAAPAPVIGSVTLSPASSGRSLRHTEPPHASVAARPAAPAAAPPAAPAAPPAAAPPVAAAAPVAVVPSSVRAPDRQWPASVGRAGQPVGSPPGRVGSLLPPPPPPQPVRAGMLVPAREGHMEHLDPGRTSPSSSSSEPDAAQPVRPGVSPGRLLPPPPPPRTGPAVSWEDTSPSSRPSAWRQPSGGRPGSAPARRDARWGDDGSSDGGGGGDAMRPPPQPSTRHWAAAWGDPG